MTSEHYRTERESREYLIDFGINRGHKDGPEIHILTSTGVIVIKNYYTNKIVTKLIARPQQIQRYYTNVGEKAPAWLLTIAKQHNRLGYNKI